MKFTLSWLKKFLDTKADVQEIAIALTDIGLEVEEIIDHSLELKAFEVAHIISVKPHPSADKLQLCSVQTKDEVLQIVCGASNARENIKVVLAKIGTIIPNGKFKIKESTIRGEKSFGMLCSEEELLLSKESEGIIELPLEAIAGESFIKYYGLDDPVFDISVTPNRGDALGVYGIARDLAAKGIGKLKLIDIPEISAQFESKIKLESDLEVSPLFSFRELKELRNTQSPAWLQQLLQNIGVKSISAIVDVTNYISYSFGQPMHAYDLEKLQGNIEVGLLENEAKFKALNGMEYDLALGDLVVQDEYQIQALAGIMGASYSSCNSDTNSILLEAAVFDANCIAKTGRKLQIHTDSRHRFERNIDQGFTLKALDIATHLILSICGGEASNVVKREAANVAPKVLKFPYNYCKKISGLKLESTKICEILENLGLKPIIIGDVINLTVPSWRHDINIYEDIVEEIIRIHGYDKLEIIPLPEMKFGRILSNEQKRIATYKRMLASMGYDEVVTDSFMKSKDALLFSEQKEELLIINPISADLDYMRPSIIPNLLKIAERNLTRSIKDIAVFEVGPVFVSCNPEMGEKNNVAGIRVGAYMNKNCHGNERAIDVFDVKADIGMLLDQAGLSLEKCQLRASEQPYYHPTKSVSINLGKNIIGYFGQIHPLILKHYDINKDVFGFELNLSNLAFSKSKFGKRDEFIISDFQPNFRDYAFVVDDNQSVGEVISYINNFNKKLVKSVELFDIYSGDKLPAGKKSIAIKIQLQADDRTLNELELNSFSQEIIAATLQKFQATLRE